MFWSVGILTGGRSTRMGTNKAFLKYREKTLLEHKIQLFSGCEDILISVDDKKKYPAYKKTVEDRYKNCGPLSGIYECLLHAKNDWVFITSVDMPRIDFKIARQISSFLGEDMDCVVAKTDRMQPLVGFYHKCLLPKIKQALDDGNFKLQKLVPSFNHKIVDITNLSYAFLNVNTPADLKKMTPILAICGLKNTGKTTLIEKLIKKFKQENYRLAVIKHDGHDFDVTGTDSDRFFEAKADEVILFSETKHLILRNEQITITQILEHIQKKDFILIEGMKNTTLPKMEILRNGKISSNPENLLAVIGTHKDYRSFSRDHIDEIYTWIKEVYHL